MNFFCNFVFFFILCSVIVPSLQKKKFLHRSPFYLNYTKIAEDIESLLPKPDWDTGTIAPLILRLAWHSIGSYNMSDGSGGSQGGCLRLEPANSSVFNTGLSRARSFLEPIKKRYPSITYADLWVLAGIVAIEQMGGIKMDFLAGRKDFKDNATW